jgi:hypothetical protein
MIPNKALHPKTWALGLQTKTCYASVMIQAALLSQGARLADFQKNPKDQSPWREV